MILCVIVFLD